jgi:hypothetical protein
MGGVWPVELRTLRLIRTFRPVISAKINPIPIK